MPWRHLSLVLCKGGSWSPLQLTLSRAEASDPDLPSPDENVSLWGTVGVVGEVESYTLGRRTQDDLPVDPLPAGTDAPLDWLGIGIPDEKGFCVRTAR